MTQLNVTPEAKDKLRLERKKLAERLGVDPTDRAVSDSKTLLFIIGNQPRSKREQLFHIFEQFKQDVIIVVGPEHIDSPFYTLLDLFRVILNGCYENPEKMEPYIKEFDSIIQKMRKEFPAKGPKPKRKIGGK